MFWGCSHSRENIISCTIVIELISSKDSNNPFIILRWSNKWICWKVLFNGICMEYTNDRTKNGNLLVVLGCLTTMLARCGTLCSHVCRKLHGSQSDSKVQTNGRSLAYWKRLTNSYKHSLTEVREPNSLLLGKSESILVIFIVVLIDVCIQEESFCVTINLISMFTFYLSDYCLSVYRYIV